MADITTFWSPQDASADWRLAGGALASGLDIQTAILISRFTDRQADPDDDIPDGSGDPRGWWGDLGGESRIGSRLWQLDRAKAAAHTLRDARAIILEALQWLIDDGVVARVEVETRWLDVAAGSPNPRAAPSALGAVVTLYKPDGADLVVRFDTAWNGTL